MKNNQKIEKVEKKNDYQDREEKFVFQEGNKKLFNKNRFSKVCVFRRLRWSWKGFFLLFFLSSQAVFISQKKQWEKSTICQSLEKEFNFHVYFENFVELCNKVKESFLKHPPKHSFSLVKRLVYYFGKKEQDLRCGRKHFANEVVVGNDERN